MATTSEFVPTNTHDNQTFDLEQAVRRFIYIDGERLAYLIIFALAVLSRFWDLGLRVMSHDESLHTRYSWGLFRGDGFSHTPLMHGPVLFHMVALSYLLFGDNDFTARIYPALLGILIVMFPIFLKKWLGKLGALLASFMFLISPMILYYSRYIREDIPALIGAMVMVLAIWKYVEDRQYKWLLWLAFGQFYVFASKEVSFFYIIIFGSFLTLYCVIRLLDTKWNHRSLYLAFASSIVSTLLLLVVLGTLLGLSGQWDSLISGEPFATPDPDAPPISTGEPVTSEIPSPLGLPILITAGLLGASIVSSAASVMIGQWNNLKKFPELDLMIVMGTFILPPLTPVLMHAVESLNIGSADPLDTTSAGVMTTLSYTLPILIFSVLVGVGWGLVPPSKRQIEVPSEDDTEQPETIETSPDLLDWLTSIASSRWWAIAGLYYGLFAFFFTTMFTNPNGLGTGLIGSLAYWLAQQAVKRGSQPWYYYLYVQVPIYEFLPAILSIAAGIYGIVLLVRRVWRGKPQPDLETSETDDENSAPATERHYLDPSAPIAFPAMLFTGYWIVLNLIMYSLAGEKMPWLTVHLTAPMILLGGWVIGKFLSSFDWRAFAHENAWLVFVLLPIIGVGILRSVSPICNWLPTLVFCNTVIPESYKSGVLMGRDTASLASTGLWIGMLVVLASAVYGVYAVGRNLRAGQLLRAATLCLVGWLVLLTTRASWRAAYLDYNDATEYLVYAHTAGGVKEAMGRIDELSLRTTDGYGLRVAYDDRVSWPMSWYLRDYTNAVYYADQPSRGNIGDAPVILAGDKNWAKVESIVGDRYYSFEYIRMWWPMQDYFDMERNGNQNISKFLADPQLQRGVWDIFYDRDYTAYGKAVGKDFERNKWPLADRMRMYIRKDVYSQVWNYGADGSQVATSIDPYAAGIRQIAPQQSFGTGLLNRPHGLSIAPDGTILIADSQNHRIVKFDTDGAVMKTIGEYGLAPAESVLNEPWDVAAGPDGRLYVADTWNHRVVVYDEAGKFLNTWGYQGPNILTDPNAFWGPRGIAVADDGTVFVADTGNKRIQAFDSDGNFLRQIGSGGVLDGQVDEPAGLATTSDGFLFVADTWNQRISVFKFDGSFVRQWQVNAWLAQSSERPYITVDPQHNVYISDPDAFRIIVFNGDSGQFLYTFGDYGTINLAGGLAISKDGILYVSDTASGTIQRYDTRNGGN